MAIGFRVFLKRMTPPWEIVEAFRSIPAPNVADCLNRMCSLNSDIRLISSPPNDVMVGVALTVKTRPGDNLMIHKALSMAESHDIVIVSNGGDRNRALIGEIMASYALKKGDTRDRARWSRTGYRRSF
jgi:Demethylmenaquinone methyltransferase